MAGRSAKGTAASWLITTSGLIAPAGLTTGAQRRDYVMLKSLADALTRLASSDFQAAFAGSTNQNDYVWGKLHRITFDHPLDSAFSG